MAGNNISGFLQQDSDQNKYDNDDKQNVIIGL